MMAVFAGVGAVLAGIGLTEGLVASWLVAGFARRRAVSPLVRSPVTVLKPLHGDEPLLETALTSLCLQEFPTFQIVFGVSDGADSAVAVVRRLQVRFPELDLALVVDPTLHGRNRKVGNLINMMSVARHDLLVIADADIHVRPDYLDSLVAALDRPGVGLVTTLYAGLPVTKTGIGREDLEGNARRQRVPLSARLGATQITHGFLPNALLARAIGREDCLGATMCLRRHDLESIGGFGALVDHLADDNVLGRRINARGQRVALADTLTLTTVPETRLPALMRHELRWARTIRALEPIGFAAGVLQYPLAFALLTVLLAGGALWSIGFFLLAWVLRGVAAFGVDSALNRVWFAGPVSDKHPSGDVAALAFSCPVWLLPLRDVMSVGVMAASYGGRQVDWRGHGLHADTPPPFTQQAVTIRPRRYDGPMLAHSRDTNDR